MSSGAYDFENSCIRALLEVSRCLSIFSKCTVWREVVGNFGVCVIENPGEFEEFADLPLF